LDTLARPVRLAAEDIRNGLVSPHATKAHHRVIVNSAYEVTKALRRRMRQALPSDPLTLTVGEARDTYRW
jgi:hypothetical protein